uniref:Uncharacterized protein n=1 Tax=Arundo donax TaxID=35708 RepID=A0A0A8ZUQ9_ARUDO
MAKDEFLLQTAILLSLRRSTTFRLVKSCLRVLLQLLLYLFSFFSFKKRCMRFFQKSLIYVSL